MKTKLLFLLASTGLLLVGCKGGSILPDPEKPITDSDVILEAYTEAYEHNRNHNGPITYHYTYDNGDDEEWENATYDPETGRGLYFREGQLIKKYVPTDDEGVTKVTTHYYYDDHGYYHDYTSLADYAILIEEGAESGWALAYGSPDTLFLAEKSPKLAALAFTSCWCYEVEITDAELLYYDYKLEMYEREDKNHIIFSGSFALQFEECELRYNYEGLAIIGNYVDYVAYEMSFGLFEDGEMYYSLGQNYYFDFEPTFNEEAYNNADDYPAEPGSNKNEFSFRVHFNGGIIYYLNPLVGTPYTLSDIISGSSDFDNLNVDGMYLDPDFTKPLSVIPASHVLPNCSKNIYLKGSAKEGYSFIATKIEHVWHNSVVNNIHLTEEELAMIEKLVSEAVLEKYQDSSGRVMPIGETYTVDYNERYNYDLKLNGQPMRSLSFALTQNYYLISGRLDSYEPDGYSISDFINMDIRAISQSFSQHTDEAFRFGQRNTTYYGAYVDLNFKDTVYSLDAKLFLEDHMLTKGEQLSTNNPVDASKYEIRFYDRNRDEITYLTGNYKGFVYVGLFAKTSVGLDYFYIQTNF